jgi:hypothetical protein
MAVDLFPRPSQSRKVGDRERQADKNTVGTNSVPRLTKTASFSNNTLGLPKHDISGSSGDSTHISFAFVRETLKLSYSETGRPSIDPELLLRILREVEEQNPVEEPVHTQDQSHLLISVTFFNTHAMLRQLTFTDRAKFTSQKD